MLIPYGDDSYVERRPVATIGLIAANALVYLALSENTTLRLALRPATLAPLTFLTSMFLHAGFFHLVGNMLFLWIAGPAVEEKLGRRGYVAFYLGAGLAAGVTHVLANVGSQVPTLGASGAISGVMAAYAVLCSYRKVRIFYWYYFRAGTFEMTAGWAVTLWFLEQVFWAGVSRALAVEGGGVAYGAHIGGAIAGAAVAVALARAGIVARDESYEARLARSFEVFDGEVKLAPRATEVLESAPELRAAVHRVFRAGPIIASPLVFARYDVTLLTFDEGEARRASQIVSEDGGGAYLDIHGRAVRTGILASELQASEAEQFVAALTVARIRAVAIAAEPVAGTPVQVRAPRGTERGIEGAASIEGRSLEVRWRDVEAAEVVLEVDGERAIDIVASGRRLRLRPAPAQVRKLASEIARRAPSPLSIGRGMRIVIAGGAARRIAHVELARVLGCLVALSRADRDVGASSRASPERAEVEDRERLVS